MNSVVHFEIPADDIERAREFYSGVFGWQANDVPEMEYITLYTAEVDENRMIKQPGAINGGMMKRDAQRPNPVITISVEDIDSALEKIKASGGEEVQPKMEVGDMGWAAYFKDSEGNVMGLWQTKEKM